MTSTTYNEHYATTMARFPDKYFQLACCDIPYGIDVGNMAYLKEMNTTVKQRNGTRLSGNNNKKPYASKDWDKATPPQAYFDELCRVSQHQIIFGVEYVNWSGLGPGRIKWDKGVAKGMSFKNYEIAYCSLIDYTYELPLLWAGMQQAKSLSEPMTSQGNKKLNEKRIHPCHKPVMLYDAIFTKFGQPGMRVIDTHMGSQSSRISADRFGYDYVGCDIDPGHFSDGEARWKEYKYHPQGKLGF